MRTRARLALGSFVLLLAVQAVTLSAGWTDWFPDNCALVFTATPQKLGPDGQPVWSATISATRGPIVAGFCDIQATVQSPCGDLQGIRLLVGDDADSDGVLSAPEWTLLGSAAAVPDGLGGASASVIATSVSAAHAGYRVAHTWTWGASHDQFIDVGLN